MADQKLNTSKFPSDFMFGTATSSYQIEGAWNEDGKGECNWDHYTHTYPDMVANCDNGDIACDSYHKYEEDIRNLASLKVDFYRFSFSWARILPDGTVNNVNQAGVDYYKKLISCLKKNNILPFVTLFHWDLPQKLEDLGGWTNPFIIDCFADYANFCFKTYGNVVKHWMTFNEPKQICEFGYGTGCFPPRTKSPGVGEYMAIHNVLKSHAAAYDMYNKNFRSKQDGNVGFVVDCFWYDPQDPKNPADVEAAQSKLQFGLGIYINPLVNGDYPDIVKDKVQRRSKCQGYPKSRLPEFTEEEKKLLKKSIDFLGVNYYSTSLASANPNDPNGKGTLKDCEANEIQPTCWEEASLPWLKIKPKGLRNLLKWVSDQYKKPLIYITENGVADYGEINDKIRINWIKAHLSNVKDAIDLDKLDNIKAYTYWSLVDNFEWLYGYKPTFGLYKVDFDSPCRIRTPKDSVNYYRRVIAAKAVLEC